MNRHTIDIRENVNPHFKDVWTTKVPYNVLKGGRNSFKSSVVALQLVRMMVPYISKGERANIVVLRKVASTIRDSVFNKMQWALGKFGFTVVAGNGNGDFKATVAPFKITHNATGSSFFFYGLDQFEKLKSNDINDIIAVYYEEAAEFGSEEEFDQTNVTFMRQKHKSAQHVKFFWTYNPPRNKYHWINEWADTMALESNYLVHHSSYKDDELGFVTEQMLEDIERIKKNDYDYYRYIYLGEPVGLGTEVYNMNLFQPIAELFADDPIIMIDTATDTGHQVSATTHLAFGLTAKKKVILLDTYYYSPEGKVNKKAPSDLSQEFHEWLQHIKETYRKPIDMMTIDSAEGGLRNQLYKDYSIRLHPIAKKKKVEMIDVVHSLLAEGRFFYLDTPNNQVFIEEHRKYSWDEDSMKTPSPKVIEVDDHTCDGFIYYVNDNARKLGLKH